MIKIEAKKDGKGNIIITEDSFEMLLACIDNQKFINGPPPNGDALSLEYDEYRKIQKDNQDSIDYYVRQCRSILYSKNEINNDNA